MGSGESTPAASGDATVENNLGSFVIDRSREYGDEYKEFMHPDGFWDLYGPHSYAFDADTLLTLEEVEEILRRRHEKAVEQKQAQLAKLEAKLAKEINEWEALRAKGEEDVDVTDISTSWNDYSINAKKMRDQLQHDMNELKEIIGDDISVDDLQLVNSSNSNIVVYLLWKLFDLLRFLAKVPVQGENGEQTTMNVYERILNNMIDNAKKANNGEIPGWLKVAQLIFTFGMKVADSIDLDKSKKFADVFSGAAIADITKNAAAAKNYDKFLI